MSDYTHFNKEEKDFLEKNGYSVLSWFSWKEGYPNINRENGNLYPYSVGIEGRDRDVDGDWGWCRTWKPVKTLEEAITYKNG